MAQLLIRNLPDQAKEALRTRARAQGRSMEAEARSILVDAITSGETDPVIEWLGAADRLRENGEAVDMELSERGPSRRVEPL